MARVSRLWRDVTFQAAGGLRMTLDVAASDVARCLERLCEGVERASRAEVTLDVVSSSPQLIASLWFVGAPGIAPPPQVRRLILDARNAIHELAPAAWTGLRSVVLSQCEASRLRLRLGACASLADLRLHRCSCAEIDGDLPPGLERLGVFRCRALRIVNLRAPAGLREYRNAQTDTLVDLDVGACAGGLDVLWAPMHRAVVGGGPVSTLPEGAVVRELVLLDREGRPAEGLGSWRDMEACERPEFGAYPTFSRSTWDAGVLRRATRGAAGVGWAVRAYSTGALDVRSSARESALVLPAVRVFRSRAWRGDGVAHLRDDGVAPGRDEVAIHALRHRSPRLAFGDMRHLRALRLVGAGFVALQGELPPGLVELAVEGCDDLMRSDLAAPASVRRVSILRSGGIAPVSPVSLEMCERLDELRVHGDLGSVMISLRARAVIAVLRLDEFAARGPQGRSDVTVEKVIVEGSL
jgi:hypothetical protein